MWERSKCLRPLRIPKQSQNISDERLGDGKKKRKKLFGKRKKNKKMKSMMKFVAVAIVIVTKLSILFKIIHSHFQMKFFGIAAMGLVMQLLKFWLDVKNGYSPPKILHYDSASRPNHFNGDDIHWARQYEDDRRKHVHNVNVANRDERQREVYRWDNSYHNSNINEYNPQHEPYSNY